MNESLGITPTTALIVVDVQQGFRDAEHWGRRGNPDSEQNIHRLLQAWRDVKMPVVLVSHASTDPDSPLHPSHQGHQLEEIVEGSADLHVVKSVNSSFHGTPDLDAWLRAAGIETIVVCGISTNHCCETTARVGGNLGHRVLFALDATHSFDRTGPDGRVLTAEQLMQATATNLHGEFATVVSTEELLEAVPRQG
ncbi:cysteine hydrolase family protein [Nesterenkonia xinjiangensis]|uniref:Nicotinamidase-related amidase n=1 Tax=Nesterenkonia xinjiangensis TaxID=225327 RepID=A0A7Z0GMY7_9MICC|nr:cysteine hydrolase family protein [Nesterenkonia xinjiangensis]NYJ78668.1 nicotinamidase-related amidase [Nesterenkonia xinjiangensis]